MWLGLSVSIVDVYSLEHVAVVGRFHLCLRADFDEINARLVRVPLINQAKVGQLPVLMLASH